MSVGSGSECKGHLGFGDASTTPAQALDAAMCQCDSVVIAWVMVDRLDRRHFGTTILVRLACA